MVVFFGAFGKRAGAIEWGGLGNLYAKKSIGDLSLFV
jgi:hypothetical protein